MNIYEKLAEARTRFLQEGASKSGVNTHAEFKYFELEDIVPKANCIFSSLKLIFLCSFANNTATGMLIDTEKPDGDRIYISFNMTSIAEPAKFRMNEIQALGANITYCRRYLYFILLDIVEADEIDAGTSVAKAPAKKQAAPKKPATTEERAEAREELTKGGADALQIEALKSAVRELLIRDESQQDFVTAIIEKTDNFTNVSREECETLINGISDILSNYTEE